MSPVPGASKGSPESQQFLGSYDPAAWPRPSVTVDVVMFTVIDSDLKVLLVLRDQHPFKGQPALPGGFVQVGDGREDQGESLLDAAHRVLETETGLPRGTGFLEQLYTFGDPGRDPRTRVIDVAWYALVRPDLAAHSAQWRASLRVQSDPGAWGTPCAPHSAQWASVAGLDPRTLAFDHAAILTCALDRIRGKIDYAPLGFELVPPTFTIPELRSVFEAVKGATYDAANFRRRFKRMLEDGLIEPAPGHRATARKPAPVYRFLRAPAPG